MPDEFIAIDVVGLDEIIEKLKNLPPEAADQGIEEADGYLLNVFRTYPPQKSVTRKQAYGVMFFTEKQRRGYFAKLRSGEIQVPYKRTQGLARGWKKLGYGQKSILVNETPYAYLVQQKATQSRHMTKIGWKPIEDLVKERMPKVLEKFGAGVKKAIRKLGL